MRPRTAAGAEQERSGNRPVESESRHGKASENGRGSRDGSPSSDSLQPTRQNPIAGARELEQTTAEPFQTIDTKPDRVADRRGDRTRAVCGNQGPLLRRPSVVARLAVLQVC